MTRDEIVEILGESPVIAAVKDEAGLAESLACNARVVFTLFGSVLDIGDITRRIAAAGKVPIVHIDLVEGLSAREAAVDFIAQTTEASGVISTRPAPLRRAREVGLLGIRRFFLLDSMAIDTLQKQLGDGADLVEVLPGAMPKVLRRIAATCPPPLIAGGLISDKEDVMNALSAGAVAISTTKASVWNL